jgi:hypothetical protein
MEQLLGTNWDRGNAIFFNENLILWTMPCKFLMLSIHRKFPKSPHLQTETFTNSPAH